MGTAPETGWRSRARHKEKLDDPHGVMGAVGENGVRSYLAGRPLLYFFPDSTLSFSPLCLLSQGFSTFALSIFGAGSFFDVG